MHAEQVTLFISHMRAFAAGAVAVERRRRADDFRIHPGTVRWDDGTTDRGFKVELRDAAGASLGFL